MFKESLPAVSTIVQKENHLTCHSDTGKVASIFLKSAADAFGNDEHLLQYWKQLNFIEKPDFLKASAEYSFLNPY